MTDLFDDVTNHADDGGAPAPTRSRANQRNAPAARRRRRGQRLRSVLIVLVTAALVVGGMWFVKSNFGSLTGSADSGAKKTVSDYPGPGTGDVEVMVKQGASGGAIGASLVEAGVVATQKAFTTAIKDYTTSFGAAPNLQYGTYKLQAQMPASDALTAMLDSANRIQNGVTLREGLLVEDTIAKLSATTAIPVKDFEAALKDPEAIGLPAEAKGSALGWLAPARYPYTDDTTAVELLSTMIAKQKSDLTAMGVEPADWMTVLTKASLVEKEAPAAARDKVARVIENRLAIDMALEFDSTVHFVAGGGSADASTTVEQRAVDSPYNTYKYAGLPPGPIANPGKAAIEAVLNPAVGDWIFFVTVDTLTGETKFAVTHDEHLVNKRDYQLHLQDLRAAQDAETAE